MPAGRTVTSVAEPTRSERIRQQQAQGPPPSPEDAYKALLAMLAAHLDCEVQQSGRCVYCCTHGARLHQGTPFSDEEKDAIRAECERLDVPVGKAPSA